MAWVSPVRIDTLAFSVWCALKPDAAKQLDELVGAAQKNHRPIPAELARARAIEWQGQSLQLLGQDKHAELIAECGEWKMYFMRPYDARKIPLGEGSPQVRIWPFASTLARYGAEQVCRQLVAWVRRWATVYHVKTARLDLACDQVSSEPGWHWFTEERFVGRATATPRTEEQVDEFDDGKATAVVGRDQLVSAISSGRKLAMVTVGARGRYGTQLRIYNKLRQVRRVPKSAWHVDDSLTGAPGLWTLLGCDYRAVLPPFSVWRTEAEYGAKRLDSVGMRTLGDLFFPGRLDRLWAWTVSKPYAARIVTTKRGTSQRRVTQRATVQKCEGFFRVVGAGFTKQRIRDVSPFWRAVQEAVPEGVVPARPVRSSAKASAERMWAQVLGSIATAMAKEGSPVSMDDALCRVAEMLEARGGDEWLRRTVSEKARYAAANPSILAAEPVPVETHQDALQSTNVLTLPGIPLDGR